VTPLQAPLQLALPAVSVPHTQAHLSTSSTRVGPQSTVASQAQAHSSVLHAKPAAHVAVGAHTQAQASSSQTSPPPQPPQPALHCTVQVARSQRSVAANGPPVPQSLGHCQAQLPWSQTKAGLLPGGGRVGVARHSKPQVSWLHTKSGDGDGAPQSAGHSQAQVATLHSALPSQPPQSTGQRNSHVAWSHTAAGPGDPPPQSAGQA